MFGSMVGIPVWVGTGVSVAGLGVSDGKNVPVGVQGNGWKGVRVGDAFGAAVTKTKGRGCACAVVPHPVSRMPARRRIWRRFIIYY
jgi:hypothetical protein